MKVEGALWEKRGEKGLYLIGNITIDGQKIEIVAYANELRNSVVKPDWIIEARKNKPN